MSNANDAFKLAMKRRKFLEKIEELLSDDDETKFLSYLADVLRKKSHVVMPAKEYNQNIHDAVNARMPRMKMFSKIAEVPGNMTIEGRRDIVLKMLREICGEIIEQKQFSLLTNYSSVKDTDFITVGLGVVKGSDNGSAGKESETTKIQE